MAEIMSRPPAHLRVSAGALIAAGLVLSGCTAGGVHLKVSGTANEVELQLPVKAMRSYVHGSYPICLDQRGRVEITSVRFSAGEAEITDWAVRPAPQPDHNGTMQLTGDRPGTLSALGIDDVKEVSRACDDLPRASYDELVLQLHAGETSTEGQSPIVTYVSDGKQRTLVLPERVVLCVRPDPSPCR